MRKDKSSWHYQKGKYKQINIKFNTCHYYDVKILDHLERTNNVSSYIKGLILDKIAEDAGNETI